MFFCWDAGGGAFAHKNRAARQHTGMKGLLFLSVLVGVSAVPALSTNFQLDVMGKDTGYSERLVSFFVLPCAQYMAMFLTIVCSVCVLSEMVQDMGASMKNLHERIPSLLFSLCSLLSLL